MNSEGFYADSEIWDDEFEDPYGTRNYRKGDKVISDDATGNIIEADTESITVQWSENSEGGVQHYTWAEVDEYGFTIQQR